MGPMVTRQHHDKVVGYIGIGQAEGARLVRGGGKPAGLDRGYFLEPTVFADVDNSMRIAREEIFGPVISVIGYRSVDEAVQIANDSPFGLSGAVFGPDQQEA